MCPLFSLNSLLAKRADAKAGAAALPSSDRALSDYEKHEETRFDAVVSQPSTPIVEVDSRWLGRGLGMRVPLTKVDARSAGTLPLLVERLLMASAGTVESRATASVTGHWTCNQVHDNVMTADDVATNEHAPSLGRVVGQLCVLAHRFERFVANATEPLRIRAKVMLIDSLSAGRTFFLPLKRDRCVAYVVSIVLAQIKAGG